MNVPAGLVCLDRFDPRWRIELRYARPENFLGRPLYGSPEAWLRAETAVKLASAQDRLDPLGVRLKVLDAYRPPSAQAAMWAVRPDERFVAPPSRGSRHTRGTAVDVTLVDDRGRELDMGSGFDEFSPRSHRDWDGLTEGARRHRDWLTAAMQDGGFTPISTEWWHFDDADWRQYPLLTWEPGPGGDGAGSASASATGGGR